MNSSRLKSRLLRRPSIQQYQSCALRRGLRRAILVGTYAPISILRCIYLRWNMFPRASLEDSVKISMDSFRKISVENWSIWQEQSGTAHPGKYCYLEFNCITQRVLQKYAARGPSPPAGLHFLNRIRFQLFGSGLSILICIFNARARVRTRVRHRIFPFAHSDSSAEYAPSTPLD